MKERMRDAVTWAIVGLGLTSLAACVRFGYFPSDAPPPSETRLTDGSSGDGTRPPDGRRGESVGPPDGNRPFEAKPPDTRPPDTRPPDTRPPDTRPPDTRPPDGSRPREAKPPDTRPPDGSRPREAKPPDTRPPDTRPPDTRPPDTRPPDTRPPDGPGPAPDAVPPPSCGLNSLALPVYGPLMWVCRFSKGSGISDQCNMSNSDCGPGAHVCSATEFLARGGATTPSPGAAAWIGSCILSGGGQPFSPQDGPCASCSVGSQAKVAVAWSCGGGTQSTGSRDTEIGLATHSSCKREGVNQASTEGYWVELATSTALDGVVCCR